MWKETNEACGAYEVAIVTINKYDNYQPVCGTPNNVTVNLNKGYQKCIWSLLDIRKQQNKITPKPAQEETFEAGTTL